MKEEKVKAIRKFNLEGVLENTDNTPIADGVEVKLTDRSTTVSRIEKSAEEPVKESIVDKGELVFYHVGDIVTLCDNEYTRSNYGGFIGELFHVEIADKYLGTRHTLHHLESKIRILVAQENIKMIDAFSNYSVIDREVKEDLINFPKHYNKGIETHSYIESWDMSFDQGNIIKYATRYKYKNGLEDLKKCQWYLTKLIEFEERKITTSK